jgi:hypothetical protein
MNQQILKDLKPACEPKLKPTIRSRLASFYMLVFHTKRYYDSEWEAGNKDRQLLLGTIKKLCNNYSHAELNEAIAAFTREDEEFQILQRAISFQHDRNLRKTR